MVSRMAMRSLLLQNQNLLPLVLAMGVKRDVYQGAASWGLRLSHLSQPKSSLAVLRNQFASENQKWTPLQKLRFHAGELNQSPVIDFSRDLKTLVFTGYAIDTVLVMDSTINLEPKDHMEARVNWLPILRLKKYLPKLSDWVRNTKDASSLIPPNTKPSINPIEKIHNQSQKSLQSSRRIKIPYLRLWKLLAVLECCRQPVAKTTLNSALTPP